MPIELYRQVVINYKPLHNKILSNSGSSSGMEKKMVHEIFCRSLAKYNTTYVFYVGDGDAKVG
jgi:hypothetical protein